MRIPLSWLSDFITLTHSPQEISEILTLGGFEVDAIETAGEDTIIEITLTPNLGHGTSILGIAREVAALSQSPYSCPPFPKLHPHFDPGLSICIQNGQETFQYHLRTIKNIKIKSSPSWLQERLRKIGLEPVHLVVDVLNYVMFERGQPMHAFDLDKISSSNFSIRLSDKSFDFETLTHQDLNIVEPTLMIYNGDEPVAIAGVMGGDSTAVDENTHSVIIEAAHFSPTSIRRSMKTSSIRTDSSSRFEKGIDPCKVLEALEIATDLIVKLGEAEEFSTVVSSIQSPYSPQTIPLRDGQIERIIGLSLSENEIVSLLRRIECRVQKQESQFLVTPPSYRNDLRLEIDLIEEIARIYGFNHIERKETFFSCSTIPHHPLYLLEKEIKSKLLSLGLTELLTCNLISPSLSLVGLMPHLSLGSLVSVLKAKSVDQSILRPSLFPNLLQVIKHNENQQTHDLHGFEIGAVHFKDQETFIERNVLGIILSGKRRPHFFDDKSPFTDFFDLKGILEDLFSGLRIDAFRIESGSISPLHPHRQGQIFLGDIQIGVLGEVHPEQLKKLDIDPRKRVYFAEVDLQHLVNHPKEKRFKSLPAYPGSQRDLTITTSSSVSYEDLLKKIETLPTPLLKDVELIDIFKDEERIGKNKQNITLRFTYRSDVGTLEIKDVEKQHDLIVRNLSH